MTKTVCPRDQRVVTPLSPLLLGFLLGVAVTGAVSVALQWLGLN